MLSQSTIDIVKATAPAVGAHAEQITRRFYTLMFEGNPEVMAYFNPAHQAEGTQQRALAGAICAYAANIDNLAALGPAVELIAQKHCSLQIQPEHYPIVGKYLLIAVKDVLGDAATDEVIAAWGEAYGLLAQIFIDREAAIYQQQAEQTGGWNGYREFIVARKVPESDIVTSFYLKPVDGGPIATYLPGQYITVKVDPAVARSPRNYSLSDAPGQGHYRISVKREGNLLPDTPQGAISNYLHDAVGEGDKLLLGPPCGEFTLDPATIQDDRPIVLLSGGIGITPIIAMLKGATAAGLTNPIYFIHAARNSSTHALAEEVRQIAAAHDNVQVHFRYDDPLPGDLDDELCDSEGRIDVALLESLLPSHDAHYYFCGPKPFMLGLEGMLAEWNIDPVDVHYEFFGPKQELSPAGAA